MCYPAFSIPANPAMSNLVLVAQISPFGDPIQEEYITER